MTTDPLAKRCPVCCAPALPERDGRTQPFAHLSWCRHAQAHSHNDRSHRHG